MDHNKNLEVSSDEENVIIYEKDLSINEIKNKQLTIKNQDDYYNYMGIITDLHKYLIDFLLEDDSKWFNTVLKNFISIIHPILEKFKLYIQMISRNSKKTEKCHIVIQDQYKHDVNRFEKTFNTICKMFDIILDNNNNYNEEQLNKIYRHNIYFKNNNKYIYKNKHRSFFIAKKINENNEYNKIFKLKNRTLYIINKEPYNLHKLYSFEENEFKPSTYQSKYYNFSFLNNTNNNLYIEDFDKINENNNFKEYNDNFNNKFDILRKKFLTFKTSMEILIKNFNNYFENIKIDIDSDKPENNKKKIEDYEKFINCTHKNWININNNITINYNEYLINKEKREKAIELFISKNNIKKDFGSGDNISIYTYYHPDWPTSFSKNEVGLTYLKDKKEEQSCSKYYIGTFLGALVIVIGIYCYKNVNIHSMLKYK